MVFTCPREGCTVAATGICQLNHDPVSDCPEQKKLATSPGTEAEIDADAMLAAIAARALETTSVTRLEAGRTLGLEQAAQMMSARYCHMIGIIGSPDAGKTASLVSLYLLLSSAMLQSYEFADSRSLMAFDEISRGTRQWPDGAQPEQMTSHTVQPDARSAGLLHLRLRAIETGAPVDLFLPDLPGEWSTALIDSKRVDRFEFLKAADCIWIMVNGNQLRDPTSRKDAVHRTCMLLLRLCEFLVEHDPKFILVVSRRDTGEIPTAVIDSIKEAAKKRGRTIDVVEIASFSDNESVPPGYGIDDLIKSTVTARSQPLHFWPDRTREVGSRHMLQYRTREKSE